ncbi:MAG: TolC family protein, partial [Burkholderiales bacterium]
IQSRFKAGVGRGVDLEQANARLALAESNLVTETSNLHDVSARYLRIVGEAPPALLPSLTLIDGGMPAGVDDAISASLKGNAAISASIENLRAARSATQLRESVYQPRVEARVRAGAGNNFDGVIDQRRNTTAEVVLSWNLYNGGGDQARVRQQTNLLNQAADIRDKTCRDTRQTASIAYNDTRKLAEQLVLLDRNVLAIEKARDAYRQQFDIGQRSLLDLLNAENEVYTSRRAYANAEHDLGTAQLRTLASMNQLTAKLGVARPEARAEAGNSDGWSAGDDAPGRCPVEEVAVSATSRALLDQRVQAMTMSAPAAAAAPVPAPVASAPRAALPIPTTPPMPLIATDAGVPDVQESLRAWATSWSSKDVPRYLAFYAKDFKPDSMTHAAWVAQRTRRVAKAGAIKVELADVKVRQVDPNQVDAAFTQIYTSNGFSDRVAKTLTWKRIDGRWVIVAESTK